ncbi:MAG: T9SS type A sorting domain-containing protein [Candidatus Zixiibacteriota bacterium]
MRKMHIIFLIVILSVISYGRWQVSYGGESNDVAIDARPVDEGGFISCGYTESFSEGLRDIWIIRVDEMGDTLWTKTIGTTRSEWASCIIPIEDGGYIIGANQRITSGNDDAWIIRIDESGDTLWNTKLGGDDIDNIEDGEMDIDGNIVFAGSANMRAGAFGDFWLVKINQSGEILYDGNPGSDNINNGYGLEITNMGNYLIAGDTKTERDAPTNGYLVKLSEDCELLWQQEYEDFVHIYDVEQFLGGDLVIVGESRETDSPHFYAAFTNDIGNIYQEYTWEIGENSIAKSCATDGFGNAIIAGSAFFFDSRMDDIIIAKVNSTGEAEWTRQYGDNNSDKANRIRQIPPEDYILAGELAAGPANADFCLMSLDSLGYNPVEENKSEIPYKQIDCFPNPFMHSIEFNLENIDGRFRTLEIYDSQGKRILSQSLDNDFTWSPHPDLPGGIYFARISTGNEVISHRIFYIR